MRVSAPSWRNALVAACLIAALTGCHPSSPEAAPSAPQTPSPTASVVETSSPSPTSEPTESTQPPQEPEPAQPEIPVLAVITIADVNADGSLTLAGFVNGMAEDDRMCTYVVTQGSSRTSVENPGLANNGTTSCGTVTVPRSELTSGKAKIILNYDGARHAVTSTEVEVVIP